ncbi:hypothetical protein K523DRAFT_61604 [Schizophyllum commune Tattone D]|nr:hypothetical protein K523DRAFT_61604 [Schizophyllum commune Tattone D]
MNAALHSEWGPGGTRSTRPRTSSRPSELEGGCNCNNTRAGTIGAPRVMGGKALCQKLMFDRISSSQSSPSRVNPNRKSIFCFTSTRPLSTLLSGCRSRWDAATMSVTLMRDSASSASIGRAMDNRVAPAGRLTWWFRLQRRRGKPNFRRERWEGTACGRDF